MESINKKLMIYIYIIRKIHNPTMFRRDYFNLLYRVNGEVKWKIK